MKNNKNNKKEIHLILNEEQYERLKLEAEKENQKLSQTIREKIELGFITNKKLEKYIDKEIKLISHKIHEEFEELKNNIFSLHRQFLINISNDLNKISDEQKTIKEALKIIAFYSVYSSLFSTLKWQNTTPQGEISWEAVKEKRKIWKKKANEIVQKILGEGILNKIEK